MLQECNYYEINRNCYIENFYNKHINNRKAQLNHVRDNIGIATWPVLVPTREY